MKCECGNKEFNAHQLCRLDVVVDEDGDWLRNPNNDTDASIYDSETPYGPFTCTKCGKEYPELT